MFELYYDSFKQTITEEGHIGMHEYLGLLGEMDEQNMKDWEKMFISEVKELRLIQDDVKALQQKLSDDRGEVEIPEFVMDPLLR